VQKAARKRAGLPGRKCIEYASAATVTAEYPQDTPDVNQPRHDNGPSGGV